jgi:flagellar hook-associated protein 1 FlgK
MSISSSLSNAASGLSAASRSAEVISSNVANANTDGYGRRELSVGSSSISGGVRVQSVNRVANDAAIGERRLAEAALGNSSAALDFFSRLETSIGLPGETGSLSTAISTLEANLISAAGDPGSTAFLASVVSSAKLVTDSLNTVASEIKTARQQADATIASQVSQINTALENVDNLNSEIRRMTATGGDVAGLMDQRQQQIDQISEYIPLKEVPRDLNQIALVTKTGATLVDYDAATLVFQPTPLITPDMTLASGALSGLTIENASSSLGSAALAISGGSLAASFELRDELATGAQLQIDAIARNLIERFSGPATDPTLALGQVGIFTDAGADFDALNEEGVSARISISAIVDPSAGGDLTKIRDGIGSVTPGPAGETGLLVSLRSALTDSAVPASGSFIAGGSYSDLATDLLSGFSVSLQSAEARQAFNNSRAVALKDIELQGGVSTDDELQKLLLVEQAYAANARVIRSVDEMLQELLRI